MSQIPHQLLDFPSLTFEKNRESAYARVLATFKNKFMYQLSIKLMIDGEGWIGWTSIELLQISYCLWKYFDNYVGSDIEEINVLLASSQMTL